MGGSVRENAGRGREPAYFEDRLVGNVSEGHNDPQILQQADFLGEVGPAIVEFPGGRCVLRGRATGCGGHVHTRESEPVFSVY